MSGALDELTKEELAELRQMETDDAASAADEAPQAEPAQPPQQPPPAEPGADAVDEPEPKPTLVDKRAMDQERDRRKKLEIALAEQNAKHAAELARVQERLTLLTQAAQVAVTPPPAAPEAAPDPQQDPLGYVKHVTSDLTRQIGELKQAAAASDGVTRQVLESQLVQAQAAELQNWGYGQEAEFAQQMPDFDPVSRISPQYAEAMAHLRNTRLQQLAILGKSGVDVQLAMQNDVTAMANEARRLGMNFGQMLYDMSKSVGYQPKAAPAAAAAPAVPALPVPTNGAAAPNGAQRLATAQRGADMAVGLGAAGAAPRGELTPQALAEMSDAEFTAVLAKMGAGGMKQLFGD